MFYKKKFKKKLKCNFYFEASEYPFMLKLTNFVIWNNFNSFHYAGTKNTNFELGTITYNAVIFASFLTGVVLNALFSASSYRVAINK